MNSRLYLTVAALSLTIGLVGCKAGDKKTETPGMTNAAPTTTTSGLTPAAVDWEDAAAVAAESADFLQSSTQLVQDQMNAVCGKLRKKGRVFAMGSAPVAGKADQSDWIEARNIAFQRALVDAQIKTIQAFSNEITTSIAAEMFMPDKAPEAGTSSEAGIRAAAMTPDAVDPQKLSAMGIDPNGFTAAAPAARQTMLTNSIRLTATSRAVGSLVGLSVLHSFEGSDGKGGFAIGVCTVTSQKLKDFASMILAAKGNVPPQKDRAMDLNKLIITKAATEEGKKQFANQFGVLRMFDEDGSPALVSFYQAGLQGKSAAVQSQMAEVAKRQATGFADAAIATFLAGSATFDSQQGVSEMVQTMVSDTDESQKIDRAISIQQKFAAQANVRLTGITDLAQWVGKHPLTGKDIVGVVRIWSANQEFTLRGLKDNAVGAGGVNGSATGLLPNATKPTVTKSKTTMDSQDF
ncbi:MAG: hypothetical protein QM523_04680 [Candidatus Pacebacteria bacterium]|nr:hypothetical protein [Candidatus Paceibacterota bacterium]